MQFQIFTGRKSSNTVMAVEGFLSSVSSLMHFQIFTGQKSSIAIMPVQGFLSIVGYFMHSQIFTGCKSFFCNGSSGRVYLQFRFFHALSNLLWMQKLRCSHGSWRVSLSLLLSCFSNLHWTKKLHCSGRSWKVSLQCGFFNELSNLYNTPKAFFHWSQLKDLSPVWVSSCTFKSSLDAKAPLQ